MADDVNLTVREALRLHYLHTNLPKDGGRSAKRWSFLTLGGITIRLKNFDWRKRAIHCHDVHHLVTGYPCTKAGELQIAAWEFAAGRFPNLYATLFCLPLVSMGALITPQKSFSAFVLGRRSRTLYATGLTVNLLGLRVHELKNKLLPATRPLANWKDRLSYFLLVAVSLALLIGPTLGLFALLLTSG